MFRWLIQPLATLGLVTFGAPAPVTAIGCGITARLRAYRAQPQREGSVRAADRHGGDIRVTPPGQSYRARARRSYCSGTEHPGLELLFRRVRASYLNVAKRDFCHSGP